MLVAGDHLVEEALLGAGVAQFLERDHERESSPAIRSRSSRCAISSAADSRSARSVVATAAQLRLADVGTPVEIEIFGDGVAGEVAREPLFDPDERGFVQRRIDTSTEKVGQLPGRGIEDGGCLEHGPCG